MGRLHEFFESHRDDAEEAVSRVLAKADSTIDSLEKRVKDLEQKLRDFAGSDQPSGVVTSDEAQRTNNPPSTSVAAEADQSARKQAKTKKQ